MTKSVRIENADGNSYDKVRVTEQTLQADGSWLDSPSPTYLPSPTAMGTFGIWRQRRLIVEEYNDPPAPAPSGTSSAA